MTTPRKRHLLALPEAAEYLGRNEHYIRRLVAQRRIKHYRLDGRLRFDALDLEAFLESCAVEPWS